MKCLSLYGAGFEKKMESSRSKLFKKNFNESLDLKSIFKEVIGAIQTIWFGIVCTICDRGTTNMPSMKQ